MDNRMELFNHSQFYELNGKSNFVLLASSRASYGSCKDSKADVMDKLKQIKIKAPIEKSQSCLNICSASQQCCEVL